MYYIKKKTSGLYFARHIGIPGCQNHMVKRREEAKKFSTRKQAQGVIESKNIKNVEVVYETERRHTILSIQKSKNARSRL